MNGKGDVERRTLNYTGDVQGVGFRWTTVQLARGFAVNGFVRNLNNGSVELVAEGQKDELDRFLAAVADEMQSNIHQVQIQVSPGTGEFMSFFIRH
jgi:acylphosphatase